LSEDGQVKWVTLTLNFSPEQEAFMEKHARAAGLSVERFCIDLIFFRDLQGATETKEWQQEFAATLRRNGCSDNRAVSL
jgi:hypothetical protein